jgi:hypothetical protein
MQQQNRYDTETTHWILLYTTLRLSQPRLGLG